MKRSSRIAVGVVATLGLGLAVAVSFAHPGGMGPGMMHGMGPGGMGPGMMHGMGPGRVAGGPMGGPMAGRMQHDDAAFFPDMRLVHDLLQSHDRIKREVHNLPNGIRTVTQSADPQVAQAIKAHVASMEQRLKDGREFNMFSPTLPVLFENRDKIKTVVEATETGSIVTQTSSDSTVVAALQAHAAEVSELARDGMVAMMRSARASMGMMPRGPRAGVRPNVSPSPQAPGGN
ncbi:MAG TPA: hypothetical protein VLD36_07175 [Burkholderiales bacterium]|nr:hypothetical protein [Burkholderiales bacterium]